MDAGLIRISELAFDADSVLRIAAVFDELVESRASSERVIEVAAAVAGCGVGARWASGTVVRCGPAGGSVRGCEAAAVAVSDEPEVWLDRRGDATPLDWVLLDRLRHALRAGTMLSDAAFSLRIDDPALLEVALSPTAQREERARAIRLLGLDENRPVRVLAVSATSPPEALQIIATQLPGQSIRTARIGNTTAVVCQGGCDTRELADGLEAEIVAAFPAPMAAQADRGPWVGIGSGCNVFAAPASWQQALRALRFASSTGYGRRAVAYERLSALELLAELPLDGVRGNRDVARINEIAATPAGALEVQTAEAFFVFGSLRRTAAELHVHHSTVAARLAHLSDQMDWDLDDPMDRFLATLVLMVRRIALSSAELTE
ncbi:PucR family transcriptional regulator [Mycolicibacterium wolinskyi]|uniref:PucR family transcriptional regulator n=1 Tax=Mycolicibacterium wolinskyi TaxID=59750 RepID=UPI00391778AC